MLYALHRMTRVIQGLLGGCAIENLLGDEIDLAIERGLAVAAQASRGLRQRFQLRLKRRRELGGVIEEDGPTSCRFGGSIPMARSMPFSTSSTISCASRTTSGKAPCCISSSSASSLLPDPV